MNNLLEIRAKAQDLRRQKKYSEALPLYRTLWEEINTQDKWDGWGYAYCLNQLKEYNTAYQVSKKVYELDNSFEYNQGQFSWAAYMINIKDYPTESSLEDLEKYVNEIIMVTNHRSNDLFREQAILKVMDHALSKTNWQSVIEWSKKVDPDKLSTKAFKGESANGKKFTKPSDKESYYLKLSKALERNEQFQECVATCDKALISFPDEIWLKWHKGSSLRKLKKYSEAIKLLEEVKLKKQDWFIYRDLSAAYYGENNYDKAYENFIDGSIGAIRVPDPQNRWELYYLGAMILYKLNKVAEANKHIALVYKLREENGWAIQDFINKFIDNHKVQLNKTSTQLLDELKKFWSSEKSKITPLLVGQIKNMIGEGKAGFIKGDNGIEYYFKVGSFIDKKTIPAPGKKVQFSTRKSFDKKKNKESEEAINIKAL